MRYFAPRVLFCLFALTVPLAPQAFAQRPPGCAPAKAIYPFVCVMPDPRPIETEFLPTPSLPGLANFNSSPPLIAYFGYINTCSEPIELPHGGDNFFFPGDPFRDQPTVFEPGIHARAVVTRFEVSTFQWDITWSLDGNSAKAQNDPLLSWCQQPPTSLIWKGAWSSRQPYFVNDVVSYNGSTWIARAPMYSQPNGPGDPPNLSGPANLNVTPGEGAFWTALGQRGEAGPQGPPGNDPAASSVFTLPTGGLLMITDARVTPTSMITLQYVGGGPACSPPAAIKIQAGRFTVVGVTNKQFRYVIFN